MSRRLMEFGAGSDGSSAWGCRAAATEGARWSCSGMNRGAIAHWMSLGEGAWASGQRDDDEVVQQGARGRRGSGREGGGGREDRG